jgi:type II secretory pathway pseudopilin PulG
MAMFKPKVLRKDEGFTMVEVLVAILLTTLFVGIAMQAVVIAALFKAKAQENTEATNWIQQDLEQVKFDASSLQFPQVTLNTAAASGASSLTINTTVTGGTISDFSANAIVKFSGDSTNYKITNSTGTGATRTLTISPSLNSAKAANTAVSSTQMCDATTAANGLATKLQSGLSAVSPTTKTIKGKGFTLTRTTTVTNSSPFTVLQVNYDVSVTSVSNSSIAKFYVEVIPDVAFDCP